MHQISVPQRHGASDQKSAVLASSNRKHRAVRNLLFLCSSSKSRLRVLFFSTPAGLKGNTDVVSRQDIVHRSRKSILLLIQPQSVSVWLSGWSTSSQSPAVEKRSTSPPAFNAHSVSVTTVGSLTGIGLAGWWWGRYPS